MKKINLNVHLICFCVLWGCSTITKDHSADQSEECLLIAENYFSRDNLTVTGIKDESCYLEIKDNSEIIKTSESLRLIGPRIAKVNLRTKQFFLIPRR